VLASALSLRHPDSVSKVASSDFYALVAQVIPVFFIALAFETRSTTFLPPELNNVRGIDSNRARRLVEVFGAWYTLVVTLFLAGGMIAALVGLRLGRPLDFHVFHTAWFVSLGLVVGGMGVVFPLAARQLLIVAGGLESITMLRLWMAIVVILGIAAIATYTVFELV